MLELVACWLRRQKALWTGLKLLGILLIGIGIALPAAARIDSYVNQYLRVSGDIELPGNAAGDPVTITPDQLALGKDLFQSSCINCHVGGATLPDPRISLSMDDLRGATPARDNLAALMAFQRDPSNYDGSDVSFGCREVSKAWMDDHQLQALAAFLLRSAQVAPNWGQAQLERGG
ncbi:MAG: photosystem II cytochrome PsbV2 [Synechococcaceae cyanobacterium SM2_3_2]|nr:photosystem II cytochrome PsbV2 [Synechococcaceae cyanobacterium SM2_3_2]